MESESDECVRCELRERAFEAADVGGDMMENANACVEWERGNSRARLRRAKVGARFQTAMGNFEWIYGMEWEI